LAAVVAAQIANQQRPRVLLSVAVSTLERLVDQVKLKSVKSTIVAQFEQVAVEQRRKLAQLTDDLKLLDCGLDSLSFALIVARLEDELAVDPFADDDVRFPVTFGEFVKLYEAKRK
jgi:acyl carrier protein